MKIFNTRVYGLEESITASAYPMISELIPEWNDEIELTEKDLKRAGKLGNVQTGTGHDSYLKGVTVQFDITYPVYWSPQFQRYHFADIISSTSAMHRIHKIDIEQQTNKYVLNSVKTLLSQLVQCYNYGLEHKAKELILFHPKKGDAIHSAYLPEEIEGCDIDDKEFDLEKVTMYELYMRIISNAPQGLMKTMRVTTNYLQLKTIYLQRRNHKLKEDWGVFCDWCLELPKFKELCINK